MRTQPRHYELDFGAKVLLHTSWRELIALPQSFGSEVLLVIGGLSH